MPKMTVVLENGIILQKGTVRSLQFHKRTYNIGKRN